jgi:hypothetical protein
MGLKATIESEIKKAMLSKEKDRLRALRAIKSAILLAETEKGQTGDLDSNSELKVLTKAAKQRKDSLDVYEKQGRQDLAEIEKAELSVIEEFLPTQMSEAEIRSEVSEIIKSVGAQGMKDMGKVMGLATKNLAGKADGKSISSVVKELLSS